MKDLSKKVMGSCFLAACLEMYDFAIFGFFSSVLHSNYLSFLDKKNAMIIAYALFAVGFIFRPLGSLIFGYIGDVYGRRIALILSVSFMGSASLAMFLMPSYAMIGILSCYLIALIRIVQGISVGGEYSGALIYAVEHFNKKKSGLVGGVVICGCITGVLLASIVSKILQNPELPEYSWRFAFLLGFGLSAIGYFIRKNLLETPEFKRLGSSRVKVPLIAGLKNYTTECIGTIFAAASLGINFYFILIFLPGYINKLTGLDVKFYPTLTTVILIILSPMFGWLSDKLNRAQMLKWSMLAISCYSFVGLQLVALYPTYSSALLFFCGHAIIFSIQASTANIFIIEVFPPQCRFSCASVCYSLGMGVVGGTSPLLASLILDKFDNPTFYLSSYITMISFLGYVGVRVITSKKERVKEVEPLIAESDLVWSYSYEFENQQ